MNTSSIEPKDMDWLEKGVFGIDWSDGHKGVYPIRYLRLHCPCAGCTDEWTGELKLKPDDVPVGRIDDSTTSPTEARRTLKLNMNSVFLPEAPPPFPCQPVTSTPPDPGGGRIGSGVGSAS